ncbi:helix-turn-helix transcriptional regulator [Streptomyces sp. NPDC052109]|uniref:helix-turn-helix domain-containing protein n=1 Tax=Streptomyces sp. NPDC052109 TaxID=3155527 RepID=UPI003442B8E0
MSEGRFGALLRARRSEAGLTQEELAERSGLSVRAIRDLERGRVARPRRETLRLLATALGLSEDEGEELLRLARQALPLARPGRVDSALPTAPAAMAPTDRDDPHPTVVAPDEPGAFSGAEAAGDRAGHARGRGRAARYGVLLTALLTVTAISSDHGPMAALSSHHGSHVAYNASRTVHAIRVASADMFSEQVSTTGADLQVLNPVAWGDALIVTVTLTDAASGAVTVTDTDGNIYQPYAQLKDSSHRLMLFALVSAQPLTTLDQITVHWPKATYAYATVDAFRGIDAAGPWSSGESNPADSSDTESFSSGDLPPCTAGDLLFTAVSSPHNPAFRFDAPWQPLAEPQIPNPPLATAYRSVTSTDQHCTSHGTATTPWQNITLRLH